LSKCGPNQGLPICTPGAPHFHCPRTELRPHALLRPRSRAGASHRRSCSSALPAGRGWQPLPLSAAHSSTLCCAPDTASGDALPHDFAGLFTNEHPLGMPAPSLPFQLCETNPRNPSVSYLYSDLGVRHIHLGCLLSLSVSAFQFLFTSTDFSRYKISRHKSGVF
jgi:hypothetical protein